ncbi:hypothetical protein J3D45_001894 [Microbacterium foliorum]|uniref:hypothetical protein n=1 Tax=Microbacterium foliorum TaxID=104336 RepID=UPI0020A07149|nr:hypothetical protein [Microbacterium foliorum]MCP1429396.1 hypothetical protein [Microbacterium foliorum]
MHRSVRLLLALTTSVVLLTACAPQSGQEAASPSATTPPSSPPSSTPTPAVAAQLVITIDGVEYVDGDDTATAPFEDAASVLALLEDATGELPAPVELESPPGYEIDLVRCEWNGLMVVTDAGGTGSATVTATAPTVDGVAITTDDGLAVGSSRTDVVSAGGWDVWDEDGDGIAEQVGVGHQEVEGTTSLSRPGEVGIMFVLISLDGDLVSEIQSPSNDYSDL